MTETEAKELLISLINYAAYRETPHSLWPSDMNRLFGEQHYAEDRIVLDPSVWDGDQFEVKMAELLTWGTHFGSARGDWKLAVRTVIAGDSCLSRVIRMAGLANV